MHIASVVLSVLVAALLAASGIMKAVNSQSAQRSAEHLGVSQQLSRLIGAAEIAAAVGLLVGLAVRPLAITTAAAVCLLMAGAIAYHVKAQDKIVALVPAVLTAAAAIAIIELTVA